MEGRPVCERLLLLRIVMCGEIPHLPIICHQDMETHVVSEGVTRNTRNQALNEEQAFRPTVNEEYFCLGLGLSYLPAAVHHGV
jgi:hypothetical protein